MDKVTIKYGQSHMLYLERKDFFAAPPTVWKSSVVFSNHNHTSLERLSGSRMVCS